MFVQGKCYKCGGYIAVDDAQDASICPFCTQPFVVEKAIMSYNSESDPDETGEVRPASSYGSEFVVEGSVLSRYNGYTTKDIRIPDGISVIGEAAFQGMNNIGTVRIPRDVEIISEGAFSGCKNLREVHIAEGVETIDRDAFNGCTNLQKIRFPDSIRSIEAGAFTGCTSLEYISLPPKIEVLPWRIFEGCTALRTIVIPRKVTTIEDFAFAECSSLDSIKFDCMHPESDPSAGVSRIGMNAFRNCTALNSIYLPETLKFIGNQAFRGCTKLKKLVIPRSVKAIYPLAFADCTGLEQVSISAETKLYKGSNPYKYGKSSATFLNCPKLLNISYGDLQRHFWAFPAYIRSQEPVYMEQGKCRHCGGEFKGVFEKICTVCKNPKDY